ncbi:MAG: hypothetical protein IKC92_01910, partial [Tidjanibacter sp.]|nr:hypothetical protein [Tidjanibacter sp.]
SILLSGLLLFRIPNRYCSLQHQLELLHCSPSLFGFATGSLLLVCLPLVELLRGEELCVTLITFSVLSLNRLVVKVREMAFNLLR